MNAEIWYAVYVVIEGLPTGHEKPVAVFQDKDDALTWARENFPYEWIIGPLPFQEEEYGKQLVGVAYDRGSDDGPP